ncbi:TraR/DksA C4-type zinc finger protein [Candidatus Nomurabacteria bacterium]|nr:TraR/DksA C4-type zinc finger protein [Candidatus Nomurabacteria bacterium]
MTIDTLYFKKKLEDEHAVLLESLEKIGVEDPKTHTWEAVPDMSEGTEADANMLADRAEDYEERSALIRSLGERIGEVSYALKKFDLGTYGICEKTGEMISSERLEANPAARTATVHIIL